MVTRPMPGPAAAPAWLERIPLSLRRAVYFIVFMAVVLGLAPWAASQLDRLWPSWNISLPLPVRLLGGLILLAFVVIYAGCSWWLMSRGRGAYVEFDPPREFVADGPFRWCRNPIAACVVGTFLGQALLWSSLGVLLVFLIAAPIAHLQVVRLEEPLLRQRFGQAYERYLQTVPRWIPRRPRNPARDAAESAPPRA